jgi:hypothetical protein
MAAASRLRRLRVDHSTLTLKIAFQPIEIKSLVECRKVEYAETPSTGQPPASAGN